MVTDFNIIKMCMHINKFWQGLQIYYLQKEFIKEETLMNYLTSNVNGSFDIEARKQRMLMPPDGILRAYEAYIKYKLTNWQEYKPNGIAHILF